MNDTDTLLAIVAGVERRLAARRSIQTGEAWKELGYEENPITHDWRKVDRRAPGDGARVSDQVAA